jgi:hypothetical protein
MADLRAQERAVDARTVAAIEDVAALRERAERHAAAALELSAEVYRLEENARELREALGTDVDGGHDAMLARIAELQRDHVRPEDRVPSTDCAERPCPEPRAAGSPYCGYHRAQFEPNPLAESGVRPERTFQDRV